jgi:uncharacterized DUF497 family protein
MTKENSNTELATNLLTTILGMDAQRFQEMKVFFSEAFLNHTSDDIMEETEYRIQWVTYVDCLHQLSLVFKNVSDDQIRSLLATFDQARKELSHV